MIGVPLFGSRPTLAAVAPGGVDTGTTAETEDGALERSPKSLKPQRPGEREEGKKTGGADVHFFVWKMGHSIPWVFWPTVVF